MRIFSAARWAFPLYLLVFTVFIIPITLAGLKLLPSGVFSGDTFVLALPMQHGYDWLTVLAFLGGFSAATGMVIVACVALSTMISNEIVMPALLQDQVAGLVGAQRLLEVAYSHSSRVHYRYYGPRVLLLPGTGSSRLRSPVSGCCHSLLPRSSCRSSCWVCTGNVQRASELSRADDRFRPVGIHAVSSYPGQVGRI